MAQEKKSDLTFLKSRRECIRELQMSAMYTMMSELYVKTFMEI